MSFIFVYAAPVGHRNRILRTIKDVKKEELEDNIPDEFLCPITREVMEDPVIAAGKKLISNLQGDEKRG